jgi:hypothetical protein
MSAPVQALIHLSSPGNLPVRDGDVEPEYSAPVGRRVGPQDVRLQPVQALTYLSSHGNLPVQDGDVEPEYLAPVGGGVGTQDVCLQPVQAIIHLSSHGNLPVRDGYVEPEYSAPVGGGAGPRMSASILSRLSSTCPATETYLSGIVMLSLNIPPL